MLSEYRCLPGSPESLLPFCDRDKTHSDRVAWLVANLTAAEMVTVINKGAVGRLNLPSYAMWCVSCSSIQIVFLLLLWPSGAQKTRFPSHHCYLLLYRADTLMRERFCCLDKSR